MKVFGFSLSQLRDRIHSSGFQEIGILLTHPFYAKEVCHIDPSEK
jgi:hypothetical protein